MRLKYTFDFHFNTLTIIGIVLIVFANLITWVAAFATKGPGFGAVVTVFIFTVLPFLFGYLGGKSVKEEISKDTVKPDRVNYSHTGRGY
jgi:hypothetical protein